MTRFDVKLTIRGTETVEMNYGKSLTAASAIASVASIIADYEPQLTNSSDTFHTELVSIRITVAE